MLRILPTDSFMFILVIAGIIFIFYARRRVYWLNTWQQIRTNHAAVFSLVLLSLYGGIALFDSIHFVNKNTGITLSLFDLIVTPLLQQVEKTYSAPFATHQYTKESVELSPGTIVRMHPRLSYGGAHLDNPEEKMQDIISRTIQGIILGCIGALLLSGISLGTIHLFRTLFMSAPLNQKTDRVLSRRVVVTTLMLSFALVLPLALLMQFLSYYHILGTDKVGNDVLYRALKSVRTGLILGSVTTLIIIPGLRQDISVASLTI